MFGISRDHTIVVLELTKHGDETLWMLTTKLVYMRVSTLAGSMEKSCLDK